MAFDPQSYLQDQSQGKGGFDPIAYLSGKPQPSQSIPDAVKEALTASTKTAVDMGTLQNEGPVNMAKALPAIAGAAGAVLPIPGGATAGTVGGRQLSNLALKSIGRAEEIPSTVDQVKEGVLAGVGDIVGPAIKAGAAGKAIGQAEKNAGVITRAPLKLPTAGNVGTALDELETTLKQSLASGKPLGPQSARDAYAVAKYVAGNPNIVGKSDEIAVQAARVRAMAQAALNKAISGRAGPAADMASAMKIPNAIGRTYQKLPGPVKLGLGFSAGATPIGLAYELGKRVLGQH